MNVSTRNGDVVVTMTPAEAYDLVAQLQLGGEFASKILAAARHGHVQRLQINRMWSASNPPQDIPAHSAERDQREDGER